MRNDPDDVVLPSSYREAQYRALPYLEQPYQQPLYQQPMYQEPPYQDIVAPHPQRRRAQPIVLAAIVAVLLVVAVGAVALFHARSGTSKNAAGTAVPAASSLVSPAPSGDTAAASAAASAPPSATQATAAAGSAGSPSATSAPSAVVPAAEQQHAAAVAVSTVIAQAASTRSLVSGAVQGLAGCTLDAASADSRLSQAIAERQALLTQLPAAQFAALPHGPELEALLRKAWTESVQADQAFQSWAKVFEPGKKCGTKNPGFARGEALSNAATHDKLAFAARWNDEVARPLQVSAFAAGQL